METNVPSQETNPEPVHGGERSLFNPPVTDRPAAEAVSEPGRWRYRHALPVRVAHWINALSLVILVMSGLQIFNAHPALYWGNRSDRQEAVLSIRPVRTEMGEIKGITTVWGHSFDTTGVFGYSDRTVRAFPAWATVPGPRWLAMGRQWHLFFAWIFVLTGLLYVSYAVASRHLFVDLLPSRTDLRGIGRSIIDHLLFRQAKAEAGGRYNVLQKLSYLGVLFVLAPVMIVTGLSMSPMLDAAFPWLLQLFGGRQSARTIHFMACFAFVGFLIIHVIQVMATGLFTNLRSMITGWVAVRGAVDGR